MIYDIQITGVPEVLKMFKKYGEAGEIKFADITAINAEEISSEAKLNAQGAYIWDTGKLVQNIGFEKVNELTYSIFSAMHYSAYQEFGTGDLVDVPKGMEMIARQFIGRGVKKVNIPARPFLYPALTSTYPQYKKDLQRGIFELNTKFSK